MHVLEKEHVRKDEQHVHHWPEVVLLRTDAHQTYRQDWQDHAQGDAEESLETLLHRRPRLLADEECQSICHHRRTRSEYCTFETSWEIVAQSKTQDYGRQIAEAELQMLDIAAKVPSASRTLINHPISFKHIGEAAKESPDG